MANNQNDSKYMKLSLMLYENSHDPHRQVGAVIVDHKGVIISQGANKPPAALGLSRSDSQAAIENDPAWKYFFLEHAERNAIYTAHAEGKALKGYTMYATLYPCADCARAIVSAGISRLVVPEPGHESHRDKKWLEHYHYAKKIFELGGVTVDFLPTGERASIVSE
jgi:dCMP deaminase